MHPAAETASDIPFHIEHIVASQHARNDDPSNLALACDRCNLYKGPNLTSIDPLTNELATLFHPREDNWNDHFQWNESRVEGTTPCGRATVKLLQMNAMRRVQLRKEFLQRGETL